MGGETVEKKSSIKYIVGIIFIAFFLQLVVVLIAYFSISYLLNRENVKVRNQPLIIDTSIYDKFSKEEAEPKRNEEISSKKNHLNNNHGKTWEDNEKFFYIYNTKFYSGHGLGVIFQGAIRPIVLIHQCYNIPIFFEKVILSPIRKDHVHDYSSIFKKHVFFDPSKLDEFKKSEIFECSITEKDVFPLLPKSKGWVIEKSRENEFCQLGCLKEIKESIANRDNGIRMYKVNVGSFVENYSPETKEYMIENDWLVDFDTLFPKIKRSKREGEIWAGVHIRAGDVNLADKKRSLEFDLINKVHSKIKSCANEVNLKVKFFGFTNAHDNQKEEIMNSFEKAHNVTLIKDKNSDLVKDFTWAKNMDILSISQSSFGSVLYTLNPDGFYLVPENDPHFFDIDKDSRIFYFSQLDEFCESLKAEKRNN